MAEKSIVTGQYVRIRQTPASVGERMLAQLIDWVIQFAYLTMWWILTTKMGVELGTLAIILLILLPVFFYCPLCEILSNGQTIGKRLFMLRVIMADGTLPSPAAYLLRWLLMIVDGPLLGYVGVLVMIINRNNQRLGDMAAGTLVVKLVTRLEIFLHREHLSHMNIMLTEEVVIQANEFHLSDGREQLSLFHLVQIVLHRQLSTSAGDGSG